MDTPCPSPKRTPVTINHIQRVEYRVDDGPWQEAQPMYDEFDSAYEDFTFRVLGACVGEHMIAVRALNNVENVSSETTTVLLVPADSTPPTDVIVQDDGKYTNSACTLRAKWSAVDPESGIGEYAYTIGTSPTDPGCDYVKDWTSVGCTQQVSVRLSLEPGITYFFYVKAANSEGLWSESAASDGITVKPVSPVGHLHAVPAGGSVTLECVVVTAVLEGAFYVEDDDRTAGIRIVSDVVVSRGDRVTVSGIVNCNAVGERVIDAENVEVVASAEVVPAPLGMQAKLVGQDPLPSGNGGLANVGLLVRTWGIVDTSVPGVFTLKPDWCGLEPLRVLSDIPVATGQVVAINGVASLDHDGSRKPILIAIETFVLRP